MAGGVWGGQEQEERAVGATYFLRQFTLKVYITAKDTLSLNFSHENSFH